MIKEEIVNYFKENELDFQRASATLTLCDLVYGAYAESDILYGIPFSPIFISFELKAGSVHRQIVAKSIITRIAEEFYAQYCKDPKSIERLISGQNALGAEIDKIWVSYQEKRHNSGNKEIAEIYKRLCEVSTKWWHFGAFLEDHGAIIHDKLVPQFAERHGLEPAKADEIFNILSHPEEQTVLNRERGRFLDICLDVAQGKHSSEKIKNYLEDFFWFKSNFYKAVLVTEESLIKEAKREIEQSSIAGIKKEIENNDKSLKRLRDEKAGAVKNITLQEDDKKDLSFAEKVIYWMDLRKIGTMKDFYYLMTLAEDAAKKAEIPYDDLATYSVDELFRFLDSGARLVLEEVKSRKNGIFLVWQKNKPLEIFYGEEASLLLNTATALSEDVGLKGQVASRGGLKECIGKAKVILDPSHDQFNDGDILVTSMTRVEFLPMMRKAKAVITDEGGIACHAAIVSRELGIPAIIGTKVATRMLKNGDNIEMDLEKGMIKVLK